MFQINSLFLQKFGWTMNVWAKEIPYTFVSSDRIYGILYEDNKVYFIKSTNNNYSKNYFGTSTSLKQNIEEKVEIISNSEMVNLIKKNEACVKDYQRHFKLSSILKK
jgi:hypothetical protein